MHLNGRKLFETVVLNSSKFFFRNTISYVQHLVKPFWQTQMALKQQLWWRDAPQDWGWFKKARMIVDHYTQVFNLKSMSQETAAR